jgi:hypothetical protein
MKELNTYNRAAGYLQKIFRIVNAELFNGELPPIVITIQSSPKAYGHYTVLPAWEVGGELRHEINLGAGTLGRPIEETCATLVHECCHAYASVKGLKDTSNRGMYHNSVFRDIAIEHGLICENVGKPYGWTKTSAGDELLDLILRNDLTEIKMNRIEATGWGISTVGGKAAEGGTPVAITPRKSNYRRYICPKCGLIARTTRDAKIMCGSCMELMIEA